jgi:hypothetical protein
MKKFNIAATCFMLLFNGTAHAQFDFNKALNSIKNNVIKQVENTPNPNSPPKGATANNKAAGEKDSNLTTPTNQVSSQENKAVTAQNSNSDANSKNDEIVVLAEKTLKIGLEYLKKDHDEPWNKCLRDMTQENSATISSFKKQSDNALTKNDKQKYENTIEALQKLKELLPRAQCFTKFHIALEDIFYGSYLTEPATNVFTKLKSDGLTVAGVKSVNDQLSMNHKNWIERKIKISSDNMKSLSGLSPNQQQNTNYSQQADVMTGVRFNKFEQIIGLYDALYEKLPQYGCQYLNESFVCR